MADSRNTMEKETLETEVKSEVKALERKVLMIAVGLIIVLGGGIAAFTYVAATSQMVYIEKSDIEAPEVDLSPSVPGVVRNIFVQEGQVIPPNTVVAQVGEELIKSTAGGLVISASHDIGKSVAAGTPVVKMVNPNELRVVGQVDENKGLSTISVGDVVSFTVDAFGGKSFAGVVDEVSPTSHASGVVFNISDQRQTQTFDVKVRYDSAAHPELKNGMSARMWIYTK